MLDLGSMVLNLFVIKNKHSSLHSELDDGSVGYTKVIAHAQREPDEGLDVLVITAENTDAHEQQYQLHLTPSHNVFVRKQTAGDNLKFKPM